jgi:hypothetical protein
MTTKSTKFIVQTAAAQMPASCKYPYRRVAVLEVAADVERVAMISARARGVVRVVQTWEKLNVGRQVRSAYAVALLEANKMAAELNGGAG